MELQVEQGAIEEIQPPLSSVSDAILYHCACFWTDSLARARCLHCALAICVPVSHGNK